ncbi:hypothetical protein [Jiella mangrovi]|uniref:Uncharacterized protein n=1 Tax=Jiella mangrovi TaxID=2821407 RepID=A0ABS4BNA4_9HYPH|nr:hypothetical protein [Jiella mangrovi]MBP0618218.1 hypothetical protein [Jiella mangrovi]
MKISRIVAHALPFALAGYVFVQPASAQEPHVAPINELVNSKLKAALNDPTIIAAIKAQNEANQNLSQSDVDNLDQKWRSEVGAGGGEMVDGALNSPASDYLKKVRDEAGGLITEVFVMDSHGLNVAQSDPTSDYWQGDEAKWQKTYGTGGETVFVDEIEQDESTQMLQSQASFTIVDPETSQPIGAATVGINLDMLEL